MSNKATIEIGEYDYTRLCKASEAAGKTVDEYLRDIVHAALDEEGTK